MSPPPRPAPARPPVISSRRHELVLRCRRLAAGRSPDDSGLLLDGAHLLAVALACDWPLDAILYDGSDDVPPEVGDLVERATARGVPCHPVAGAVMNAASPVRTPSGVVALASSIERPLPSLLAPAPALVVVALDVQDPGNVGAILRAADAFGATGVACLGSTADPFGWKALRGSMGSALRLPVLRDREVLATMSALRQHGLRVMVTRARHAGAEVGWAQGPVALVVGNEGHGVPAAVLAAADGTVWVPMREGVESLNVAVAAGVLLADARRQRGAEARP